MKKIVISLLLIMILVPASYAFTKRILWRGKVLSTEDVCKRWGGTPFDQEKFKASKRDAGIKAKMACSLLKNQKQFIGKDGGEIRKLLGNYSGHYFSEMYPTYMIHYPKAEGDDAWQLLFLLNRERKISEIIVHKNCCD